MKGQTVLLTGGSSGIGLATAKALAAKGCRLLLTYRDAEKAEKVKKELVAQSGNSDIHLIFCDLASMDSIRVCCAEIIEQFDQIHILLHNAGLWDFSRRTSKDGIERIFAVNFLAPYLMTRLLLDKLKNSAPSRILFLSSGLHQGNINFEDIEFKEKFSGFKAYRQSKLGIILLTRLLAQKLANSQVSVNCIHPGVVNTDLGRDAGWLSRWIFSMIGRSPEKGAETSIYLATAPELTTTGAYWVDKKVAKASKESQDLVVAEKLWTLAANYTGLSS